MRSTAEQARARRECFEAHRWADDGGKIWLSCAICGGRIDPARERWEADHRVRRIVGGTDDPSNVMPVHPHCHSEKTKVDVRENAKGKRASDKHFGIRRKRGFERPAGVKFDWAEGRYRKDGDCD